MKQLLFALVACVVLAGCGDDSSSISGLPGGVPGPTHSDAWKDMMTAGGKVKLTDDMMQRYVDLIQELKGADKPSAALYAKYRFNAMEYVQISQIIGTSTVRTGFADAAPKMKESLEKMKTRRDAETNPQMKAMLDKQIDAMEKQLGTMGGVGAANEVDRHNMAVLERWKDRLKAAGR